MAFSHILVKLPNLPRVGIVCQQSCCLCHRSRFLSVERSTQSRFRGFCMLVSCHNVKTESQLDLNGWKRRFGILTCYRKFYIGTRSSPLYSSESQSDLRSRISSLSSISKSPVVIHLKDLEEHMRIRGYSTLRWGLALLLATAFALYIFREPIKENISDEVADVASRSLGDETVVMKANEVSRAVLFEILNDPEALDLATDFFAQTINSESVRQASKELTLKIINDPCCQEQANILAYQALRHLTEVEETRNLLLNYIKSLLLDEQTKAACKELFQILLATPEVQEMAANFVREVIGTDLVTGQAVQLGKDVTHQVVNDQQIQEQTGNALWNAIKYIFTPGWLH